MNELIKRVTSMKVTIVCLALSLVLILVATLEQVHFGIHAIQERYFQSFVVFSSDIWENTPAIPIFPGGYTLGMVLVFNLLVGYFRYFRFTKKKAGILVSHAGLILLLVGEFLTGVFSTESSMTLNEGETKSYSESAREVELVVLTQKGEKSDSVVSIPEKLLETKPVIADPSLLPFSIRIIEYMPHSDLLRLEGSEKAMADLGFAKRFKILPKEKTYELEKRNIPSALIEISHKGEKIGTMLTSAFLNIIQDIEIEEKQYKIALRFRRYYKNFSLTLNDFTHEKYPGTNIPKDFSSLVVVKDFITEGQQESLIYMNNPLRYKGYTFFQSGFDNNDTTSILQVVENPARWFPYVSCLLMAFGMLYHFLWVLIEYLIKRA